MEMIKALLSFILGLIIGILLMISLEKENKK
jgi:ABC-type methionine transport system permease subunit